MSAEDPELFSHIFINAKNNINKRINTKTIFQKKIKTDFKGKKILKFSKKRSRIIVGAYGVIKKNLDFIMVYRVIFTEPHYLIKNKE